MSLDHIKLNCLGEFLLLFCSFGRKTSFCLIVVSIKPFMIYILPCTAEMINFFTAVFLKIIFKSEMWNSKVTKSDKWVETAEGRIFKIYFDKLLD